MVGVIDVAPSGDWSVEIQVEDVVFVQVWDRFCVDLLVGVNDGRVEIEVCFTAFAVLVETSGAGSLEERSSE